MKPRPFIFALTAALALGLHADRTPCQAADGDWPRLLTGSKNNDCRLVLQAAKFAFQSKDGHLFDAGDSVRARTKALIVWPTNKESNADSPPLGFDAQYIEYKDHTDAGQVYVQKAPLNNVRFMVRQSPFNWQGDRYSIFTLKSAADTAKAVDFVAALKTQESSQSEPLPKGMYTVTADNWQSPWIFRNAASKHVVVVDTQHPAAFFGNWDVYAARPDGSPNCICQVAFRPDVKDAFHLIPKGPLRELAHLLDDIIGRPVPGSEGTMNHTARLRNDVSNMWGDLLLRPWAIEKPPNSRQEIETNLKHWSNGSPVYRGQFARLKDLYPEAEVALCQYYEKESALPHSEAAAAAKKNLQLAFRSHFNY